MDSLPFFPGEEHADLRPLARFMPVVPAGVAAAFLARHDSGAGWVLDPFGAAPALALEMARLGRNVLVAVNNPVTRFLLELTAAPPPLDELRLALSAIAGLRKGEERMETHLQSLYMTECQRCQRQVPAEAFIWEKDQATPSGRVYHCPCGEGGEFPATKADREHAVRIAATDGLHRARALERVAAPDDPDRPLAEQALTCYLPRAVYALITLVNRLEGLLPGAARERQNALLALLLAACDEGNSLWSQPPDRPRPRQLTVPPRFLEKNIWLALEGAVARWQTTAPVPMIHWTQAPGVAGQSGGIFVFDGPARDLVPALAAIQPGALVTALPRPNQAFWTLCVLWAGWLWGHEAAASFKSVLRRRRYDWNWHSRALGAALESISPHLPLNTPVFALLAEPEPTFLTAAVIAAAEAGFDLEGLALRTRAEPAQAAWRRRAFLRKEREMPAIDPDSVHAALEACLRARGEPCSYLHLHAASLQALAADHSLQLMEDAIPQVHAAIQHALSSEVFLHHAESANIESGLWGLARWEPADTLADLVEIALVQHLEKHPGASLRALETALNTAFPGLLTPPPDLLEAILASYAVPADGLWSLRAEDSPAIRRQDLDEVMASLGALAARLGYASTGEEKPVRRVLWMEGGQTRCIFPVIASAVTGKLLRLPAETAVRRVLVLPGSRAGLLAYKLGRDPSLRSAAEGVQVLKFRQLRRIAALDDLDRARWELELSGDPLEPPEQLKLF
jgi:hypothetical protein